MGDSQPFHAPNAASYDAWALSNRVGYCTPPDGVLSETGRPFAPLPVFPAQQA
jgi:hypothetical protein